MCINFTELNLVCSKDPYSWLNIDRLIDRYSGYKTPSFMNPTLVTTR